MKKILSLILSLTIISGVCAAVLAYVNALTAEPIRATAAAKEVAAVKAVMPAGVETVTPAESGAYFTGTDAAGRVLGYAAKGRDAGGYGGDIVLMVGFEADRQTLVCYQTLAAAETPGLGMKLNTPEFAGQFAGKCASELKVVKSGAPAGNEILAITSATITSKAVCRAIQDAAAALSRE